MDDIENTLKSILGDDAEEKIKSALSSLGAPKPDSGATGNMDISPADFGLNDAARLKGMIEGMLSSRNDPRSNLLMSLRPYMRAERQKSIDSAVKLMGLLSLINGMK